MLGVVWPSLRQTFDFSHEAAGVLLVAKFFSYFASSFFSSRWANLLGGGRVLIAAAVCMTIGPAGMAAAPGRYWSRQAQSWG
jgi:fucose permease